MLKSEFTEMTGIYPSEIMFLAIRNCLLEYGGSERDFCRDYKENRNGLAEKTADLASLLEKKRSERIWSLEAEVKVLREKLENA